jgi:asparagine synthase (glutamine-hydrolysing)
MQLEDKNLYDQLINATYFQDEPVMHLSEPSFSAFTNGKTCCKVLLSGEGADELMVIHATKPYNIHLFCM